MTDPTAEQKASRRRWITFGEVLTVVAVLISALTLWNSYADRSHQEQEKAGESRKAQAKAATLVLKAEPSHDGARLTLAPLDGEQSIQSQIIAFPTALAVSPVSTTGDARIEANWFEDGLKKARRAAHRKDESVGDEQLPIAVTSHFIADGDEHDDIAIYDVGYSLQGRFLGGSRLRLRGLSRIGRADAKTAQARLDGTWAKRQPTISSGEKK